MIQLYFFELHFTLLGPHPRCYTGLSLLYLLIKRQCSTRIWQDFVCKSLNVWRKWSFTEWCYFISLTNIFSGCKICAYEIFIVIAIILLIVCRCPSADHYFHYMRMFVSFDVVSNSSMYKSIKVYFILPQTLPWLRWFCHFNFDNKCYGFVESAPRSLFIVDMVM